MVISRRHFLARYSKTPAQTLIRTVGRYLFVATCPGQRSGPPRRPRSAKCVSAPNIRQVYQLTRDAARRLPRAAGWRTRSQKTCVGGSSRSPRYAIPRFPPCNFIDLLPCLPAFVRRVCSRFGPGWCGFWAAHRNSFPRPSQRSSICSKRPTTCWM